MTMGKPADRHLGAMRSQKPQLWMAIICPMDMAALSPAGMSTISAPERLNCGQYGVSGSAEGRRPGA
jgi:hypothetical protein